MLLAVAKSQSLPGAPGLMSTWIRAKSLHYSEENSVISVCPRAQVFSWADINTKGNTFLTLKGAGWKENTGKPEFQTQGN